MFILSCFVSNLLNYKLFYISGFYIPFTFLPDYVNDMGMTSQDGAILIAIIGIMNTVGRVTAGWLIDRSWIEPIKFVAGWLIVGGGATIFVTQYIMFIPLSVYCGTFGLTIG